MTATEGKTAIVDLMIVAKKAIWGVVEGDPDKPFDFTDPDKGTNRQVAISFLSMLLKQMMTGKETYCPLCGK